MDVFFFDSSSVYCFCLFLFVFYINLQIDDKEFDIPQVDTPPTLESILNEVILDNNTVEYGVSTMSHNIFHNTRINV